MAIEEKRVESIDELRGRLADEFLRECHAKTSASLLYLAAAMRR
jgi:hypothetical protein